MAERKALVVAFDNSDKMFFENHKDRNAHIRLPFQGESAGEFWQLGDHQRTRRRILIWRVPKDSPYYHPVKQPILKIPFLVFENETVDDSDEVLLPIIDTIMREAVANQGDK
jgi:hypothetical protein